MSNYLFVDVETTGLPTKRHKYGCSDPEWTDFKAFEKCRMVQISMIICTPDFKERRQRSFIIKPDGFKIPFESVKFHGITDKRAHKEGVPIPVAMAKFKKYISDCSTFFAHRVAFDFNVIMSELHKIKDKETKSILQSKRQYCTVLNTCDIVQLPGKYGEFKYPSLSELFYYVFNKPIKHAHDARYDTYNLYMCIKKLYRLGKLPDPKDHEVVMDAKKLSNAYGNRNMKLISDMLKSASKSVIADSFILESACENNDVPMVKELIKHKYDLLENPDTLSAAIMWASEYNHLEELDYLLENYHFDRESSGCLKWACFEQNYDVVRRLLNAGISPNTVEGFNTICEEDYNDEIDELIRLFLKRKIRLRYGNEPTLFSGFIDLCVCKAMCDIYMNEENEKSKKLIRYVLRYDFRHGNSGDRIFEFLCYHDCEYAVNYMIKHSTYFNFDPAKLKFYTIASNRGSDKVAKMLVDKYHKDIKYTPKECNFKSFNPTIICGSYSDSEESMYGFGGSDVEIEMH